MEYRYLGNSGLQVSALSFGAWITFGLQVDDSVAESLMHTAYDNGINFFDNAESYADGKAEEVMGRILKKANWPRETWCVSSKAFVGNHNGRPNTRGLSRKHLVEACNNALRRLQVDYLDLFYCHRPDFDTPIEETVAAMSDLVRQGKVLYWGTSEWTGRDIALAHAAAKANNHYAPVMEQPQYNIFERKKVEVDYWRLYKSPGLGTTVWSPLASGILTGKYLDSSGPGNTRVSLDGHEWLKKRFESEDGQRKIRIAAKLNDLAREIGIPLPRLALAWCLKNPNVSSVILGASRVEQLKENLLAIEDYHKLDDALMARIDEIAGTCPKAEQRW